MPCPKQGLSIHATPANGWTQFAPASGKGRQALQIPTRSYLYRAWYASDKTIPLPMMAKTSTFRYQDGKDKAL